jgi:hypothetical protein
MYYYLSIATYDLIDQLSLTNHQYRSPLNQQNNSPQTACGCDYPTTYLKIIFKGAIGLGLQPLVALLMVIQLGN